VRQQFLDLNGRGNQLKGRGQHSGDDYDDDGGSSSRQESIITLMQTVI
jgi:hypothetical protein